MKENLDLVEYASTTDIDALGSQRERANRAIVVRFVERNHHAMVISMQRSMQREIENVYTVDMYN